MDQMDFIIEAEGLKKQYGDIKAVDDICFYVKPGECFGILGPNGAGKTSTIRMIYGFTPMTSGNLFVFGYDIARQPSLIKSKIGLCPQENCIDPDFSVKENLEVYASYFDIPKRDARKRTKELLLFYALDQRANSKVSDLSGGLLRRLVLARALINAPDLLILDEPTTGLDPQTRHQIWERLEKLKSQGLTILLTTHYMDEAYRLCDRLMIMDYGKVLVEGRPIDLIKDYVGNSVIEVEEPNVMLKEYVDSNALDHEDLGHRLIIYVSSINEGNALFETISNNLCDEGCILRMATLEDVFLKLTGRELRE